MLDLGGDGFELTSLASSITYFDLDADGFAENTGWFGAGEGLLAIDLNQNGRIDDITELFGNAQTDGFVELAALDSNLDGVIDQNDTDFGNLLVWQDANSDGYSAESELKSLAEHNIASIDLAYSVINQEVLGNLISTGSTYNLLRL